MAVTITKTFWNPTDAQWDTIAKVVFTSPNITSRAAAGTRSHILPGSPYIGTWFEAVDYMYRLRWDQEATSAIIQPTYLAALHLYNPAFDFNAETTISGFCQYPLSTVSGGSTLYHDTTNYGTITAMSGTGTTSISGVNYNTYGFELSSVNGTSTISGSSTTISDTDSIYVWPDDSPNVSWLIPKTAIVFQVTLGEAYNCRLTAWDDATHTTTNNKILDEGHYKVHSLAYRAYGGSLSTPSSHNSSNEYGTNTFVHPPGEDITLKGDTSYYGDFDLVFVANGGVSGEEHGEYLIFTPRLDSMDDSFTSGNYDFVTTLHYQYT